MKKPYLIITFEKKGNLNRILEIDFILNDEKVMEFVSITDNFFQLDEALRNIQTESYYFGYARKDVIEKIRSQYGFVTSGRVFCKLLFYCSTHMEYNNHISERDEMEVITEILQTLYK